MILRTRRVEPQGGVPSVTIQVIDTGPGMDPATLAKLFKPYFTTKSGGTGLGLPTARRIVEAHQGRIEALSEPGKGTEFTITLPLA
jgi:signal transduction histidine kinase